MVSGGQNRRKNVITKATPKCTSFERELLTSPPDHAKGFVLRTSFCLEHYFGNIVSFPGKDFIEEIWGCGKGNNIQANLQSFGP
jgi:hypothetical protein